MDEQTQKETHYGLRDFGERDPHINEKPCVAEGAEIRRRNGKRKVRERKRTKECTEKSEIPAGL